jgi:hypothetical protein
MNEYSCVTDRKKNRSKIKVCEMKSNEDESLSLVVAISLCRLYK